MCKYPGLQYFLAKASHMGYQNFSIMIMLQTATHKLINRSFSSPSLQLKLHFPARRGQNTLRWWINMLSWETGKAEGQTYLRLRFVGFGVSSLFAIKRPLERKEFSSTHILTQYLWHFNTILLLEVLQNTAEGPLSCSQC